MSLVSAKCPNCNMNLEVDNTKDAAICPYCGAPYVVEKAVNYFITGNSNIVENKVNTLEDNSADFVIRAGTLERYNGVSVEAVLPSTISIIGKSAFENCVGLIKVIIPSSVTEIKDHAFAGCERLTEISMPNSIKKIGDCAFEECVSLTEVIIPNGVIEIGKAAFNFCTGLSEVTIPNSVIEIKDCAFTSCLNLTKITLSNRITEISKGLFAHCKKLDNITIPWGVKQIGESAFRGCGSLSNISIPDTVEMIEDYALYECENLKTIEIPDGTGIRLATFRGNTHVSNIDEIYGDYVENVIASYEWKKKYYKCLRCLFNKPYDKPEPQPQPQKSSGCYIATCVYGSYDCPQVWVLRRFRDYTLAESWYGRAFIKCYYAISPILVRWFGTKEWFKMFWEKKLDKMVSKLKSEGIADTEYCDKY